MTNKERFLTFLRHYADKNLDAIAPMFADTVRLRDWNIAVTGKDAALRETAKNFAEAASIEIAVLALYESADSVAGEVHIVVDGTVHLYVVDILTFSDDGLIIGSRSYLGRSD